MASLSARQRAHVCPPSEVLPHVDHVGGETGSAIHEFQCIAIERGRYAALEELPAIARRWELSETEASIFEARCRGFTPDIPEGALAEQPLAMFADGSVHAVKGARGSYEVPAGTLVAGTIDFLWAEPTPLRRASAGIVCTPGSTLWVVDLKSGEERYVAAVDRNRQVREGALLAARWTGATTVIPALCYVEKGPGRWDVGAPLGEQDFVAIEAELRADKASEDEQRRLHEAGEPLNYVTGPHCEYCPGRAFCPPHVTAVRALVTGHVQVDLEALTDEQAARLAALVTPAAALVNEARDALKAHVERTGRPIALPDGRVWGPEQEKQDRISTRIAYELLAQEIGDEKADEAFKTSKTAIENAIKGDLAARGIKRQGAPRMRQYLSALNERGGIEETTRTTYRAHHPAPKLGA